MDCPSALSTWGLDLGFLLGLFAILSLLHFVGTLMYSKFGKGFNS
jgi:multisubunit Na+/H+ antiporter MnhF subunit